MGLKRFIGEIWARRRTRAIRREHQDPVASQRRTFQHLIRQGRKTQFGADHGFDQIESPADFQKKVPVRNYEQARQYFDAIRDGHPNVAWPGKPLYLAKTSGTTSGAKYIPITRDSIRQQIKAARDSLMFYMVNSGNSAFLDGKMMFLSGSPALGTNEAGLKVGRLSGIVNHFVPGYLTRNRVPTYETNCIEEWEEKVDKILDEVMPEDLRLISGIPPWVQMFFERLHVRTGKTPLQQWPNLQVFVQGGVDYSPYKAVFQQFFENKVDNVEVFPASEGFLAIQDELPTEGLLLNLDYGVFFEFIPMEEYHNENPRRLTIGEVELDTQYAMAISTDAGLWAYDLGDTVKFLSKNPYRLKVTGRVKHFISAFGEHVISEEVNAAMVKACTEFGVEINEFTVAPFLGEGEGNSYHEWLIEFSEVPADLDAFAELIDQEMRRQNSYYDDLRNGNMLRRAELRSLKENATREYMKSIGKLGGQNKFPRLSNDRKIADWLTAYTIG